MPERLKEILSRGREIRAKGEKLASQASDISAETTKLLSRLNASAPHFSSNEVSPAQGPQAVEDIQTAGAAESDHGSNGSGNTRSTVDSDIS